MLFVFASFPMMPSFFSLSVTQLLFLSRTQSHTGLHKRGAESAFGPKVGGEKKIDTPYIWKKYLNWLSCWNSSVWCSKWTFPSTEIEVLRWCVSLSVCSRCMILSSCSCFQLPKKKKKGIRTKAYREFGIHTHLLESLSKPYPSGIMTPKTTKIAQVAFIFPKLMNLWLTPLVTKSSKWTNINTITITKQKQQQLKLQ